MALARTFHVFYTTLMSLDHDWHTQVRRRTRPRNNNGAAVERQWCGRRVSFLFLNAMYLTSKKFGAIKAAAFGRLLEQSHWPGLVGITEVGNSAGSVDLRNFFGDEINRRYNIIWSHRSTSISGGAPDVSYKIGGGIALLIHKRLWLRPSEMKVDATEEQRRELDGHLRVWRLDPIAQIPGKPAFARPGAILRPMVITIAYIPPKGNAWGDKVRSTIFNAIESTDKAIQALRRFQDVFTVTMAHTNAPDGGCSLELDIPTNFTADIIRRQIAELPPHLHNRERGVFELTRDERLLLHRRRGAAQAADTSGEGRRLITTAAAVGKVAMSGVMGHRQSTSWTHVRGCDACRDHRAADCIARKAALDYNKIHKASQHKPVRSCNEMSTSVHDVIFLPAELVIQALLDPRGGKSLAWQCTRRMDWAEPAPVDHAVTQGHFFVEPMKLDVSSKGAGHIGTRPALEQAPRRYRPPDNLLMRHTELCRVCSIMDENAYSSLQDIDMDDIDAVDSLLTQAAISACAQAQSESIDLEDASEVMTVRRARRERHQCWVELCRAIGERAPAQRDRTAEQRLRVKTANRLYRRADQALTMCLSRQQSTTLLLQRNRAPKQFWKRVRVLACDPGAPDSDSAASYLLDHQNDDNQQFITSDPVLLQENMRQDRIGTYAMKDENRLGPDCVSAINTALAELHVESRRLLSVSPMMQFRESMVALCASDAVSPIAEADRRRGIVARDLHEEIENADERQSHGPTPGQRVKVQYPEAAQLLNREITMQELLHICAKIKDVGPGTDGVAPIILKLQTSGYTMQAVLHLFRTCMQTGCQPESWRVHRNLFLYKGKNTDPYCLSNYRGLGVDQVLLKVYSLLLMERLEKFLEATQGLSGMQGGFQRQRGPPEHAFTLAEAVRAATKRRTVYLLFLDIEKAYDSVIRPILWKRCLDKGIDGPFLASLQAIYFNAVARIDAGGRLLDPVPLEIGVLQGNPLSPALFNIYIDDAIRQLTNQGALRATPFGVPLPAAVEPGTPAPPFNAAAQSTLGQNEYLPCLYFADDGVLLSFDLGDLQVMLDITVDALRALGLSVNVRKTKWMIVPRPWVSSKDYEILKCDALTQTPQVGGQPISVVDKFDYLGVTMWWRWDWELAWRSAQQRARKAYFAAVRGGWQHRSGSLNSQMAFAHAKIFCHFNYIAALTGTGGNQTSAPWLANEDIVNWVLGTVTGQNTKFVNAQALRIESGIWPWQWRGDMLLLRMWCKFLSMPISSVFYRAMFLSIQMTSNEQRLNPATASNRKGQLHHQTWAQQLYAAASRFGIDKTDVDMRRHTLVTVQVDAAGNGHWSAPTGHEAADTPIRLVSSRVLAAGAVARFEQGATCWGLPAGTRVADVMKTWSPQLEEACHTELRYLGNNGRQLEVRVFLAQQVQQHKRLRLWATTISGSFEQPYWHLPDAKLARRLIALRLDTCPTEDWTRRRPCQRLKQLPPHERACYLCDCIDGVPDVYWPETLVHVLLRCSCPALRELRETLRQELQALSAEPVTARVAAAVGATTPAFNNDSSLLTAMQLCVGVGPGPILLPLPLPPGSSTTTAIAADRARARREAPQFIRDIQAATATAKWVRALTDDWRDIYRNVRRKENPLTSPGYRLASLVARHAVAAFSTRRKLLRNIPGFDARARDPAVASARPENERVVNVLTYLYLNFWPTSITAVPGESIASAPNLSSPVF